MRGFKNTDSWGTVGLEWCWGKLWVSEPGEVGSVELDVFGCDRECVVLGVGRIERDLCGLDLADDVEGSIVLAYAERDGQLATTSAWVAVAECSEGLVVLGSPGEDSSSVINVSVDDDERIRIVGTGNFELSEVGFELDIAL